MSETLQVFVSHATEDQSNYAEPLARRLYVRSIKAWYSEWEIAAGDSVVRKIYDEGIKKADAFVIILSNASVQRPWVNAELDVAVVNNIEQSTRLIPVKVDNCAVPESLKAKHYLSIERYGSIENIADAIADTLLGNVKAPAIGQPPTHIARTSIRLPGLKPIDARVAEIGYDIAYDHDSNFVMTHDLISRCEQEGMTKSQVLESVDSLLDNYWFDAYSSRNSGAVRVAFSALLPIAIAKGHISDQTEREIGAYIFSNIQGDHSLQCDLLKDQFPIKSFLIDAVLNRLHDKDFFFWSQPIGPTLGSVFTPTTAFKRWLESQD